MARAQEAPRPEPPKEHGGSSPSRTPWGLSLSALAGASTRARGVGAVDLVGRRGIFELGLRGELGDAGPLSSYVLLGGVAGLRLPVAARAAGAWSIHVLAEAGADVALGFGELALLGLLPAGEYQVSQLVPYVGLRLGAEWRVLPRWLLGPTVGLWTFARTDTSAERTPYRAPVVGAAGVPVRYVDYTLVRGGQSDLGAGLQLGFSLGR